MARDTEKFDYYTVSIPKNTRMSELLKQDAEDTGRTSEIGSLLSVRIADYYLLRNSLIHQSSIAVPAQHAHKEEVEEPVVEKKTELMPNGKSNALKALGEW